MLAANGAYATLNDGLGANQKLVGNGGNSTFNVDQVFNQGVGPETVVANGGGNTVNIGQGNADLTIHLGSGGYNVINVNGSQPTLTIDGEGKTDIVHFAEASDTFASAIITHHAATTTASAYTTVQFTTTEDVTLIGAPHHAVTFAGDPSIHYI